MTQAELARSLNTHQQVIQRIETNKTPGSPVIFAIAKFFNVTLEYIFNGIENSNVEDTTLTIKGSLPILTWEDICRLESNYEKNMEIFNNRELLPVFEIFSKNCFALIVSGESMTSPYPTGISFTQGCHLIVDPDLTPLHEDFIIARNSQTKTAYFRQYILDSGSRFLKPLNPSYPTIELKDDIQLIGVVIKKLHMQQLRK